MGTTATYAASLFAVLCALLSGSPAAGTWRVAIDGAGDAPTIQAAIDASASGDTVLVGPGRYTWTNQGTGNEKGFIRFLVRGQRTRLIGEMGAELTVLDAEHRSRAIYVHGMNHITVEGFTIMGGEAPDFGDRVGGGFFNHISADTIRRCRFAGNRAEYGGGISSCGNGFVTLVEDCTFTGNEAYRRGGGIAFCCNTASSVIRNCVFTGNAAGIEGGAVCLFLCSLTLERCLLVDNVSVQRGGAIATFDGGFAIVRSCTIAGNRSPLGSAISAVGNSSLDLRRSIVALNLGRWLELETGLAAEAGCNDIYGNSGGDALPAGVVDAGGNIFLDPLFCGASSDDPYTIHAASPCLPVNHPGGIICQLIGARPKGCEEVGVEKRSWSRIKSMNER